MGGVKEEKDVAMKDDGPEKEEEKEVEEPLVGVSEYEVSLAALGAMKDRLLAADALTKEEAAALRKEVAVKMIQLRRVRRDVLIGLERRKAGASAFAETVVTAENKVVAAKELLHTTERSLKVMHASSEKLKDVDEQLHIPLPEFHEQCPLPEGATETDAELLTRRIQREIDVAAAKSNKVTELKKKQLQHNAGMKAHKKFFQASLGPLEELIKKIQVVHTSLGGVPDAVGGVLAAQLPMSLYKTHRCLVAGLGEDSVRIEGDEAEARKFIKADKHLKTGNDLFPLRITARLKPTAGAPADSDASLRFYYRAATQQVVAEAVGFDSAILQKAPGDCEQHTLLFPPMVVVKCFTLGWVADALRVASAGGGGAYDARGFLEPIRELLKEIDYRQSLNTILGILRNRSCLGLSGIVPIVQTYLPTYPQPKVSVGDVSIDEVGAPEAREVKKRAKDVLPVRITITIDVEHIEYKVTGLVGQKYPHVAPCFKLAVKERGGSKKPSLRVPRSLLKLAAPQASGKDVKAALALGALPGQDVRVCMGEPSRKRKCSDAWQVSPPKYSSLSVDAGCVEEVQAQFAQAINRDVPARTGAADLGNLLMRQVLMAVFFVEAFHPYLMRNGVAWVCGGDPAKGLAAACTALHAPSDYRLLQHNSTPLYRGRRVELPTQWDTQSLRWRYRSAVAHGTADAHDDDQQTMESF